MVIWYNHNLKFTNKQEWYLSSASKLPYIPYRVYKIKNIEI